jgi:hypothetical protein
MQHVVKGQFGSSRAHPGVILILTLVWLLYFPLSGHSDERSPNLIPNAKFRVSPGQSGIPEGWHWAPQSIPGIPSSRVYLCRVDGHPGQLLALEGGPDRNGRVWCQIKGIRPHTDYLLEFDAYRPKFTNGVYLEVEIFGQRRLINQHFSYGRIQPIFLKINSGKCRGLTRLIVVNPHREVLAFGSPSLKVAEANPREAWSPESAPVPAFFPVGIYAAKPEDLSDVRAAGFNAVQSYNSQPDIIRSMAALAKKWELRYLPYLPSYQPDLSRELGGQPEILGFYIEDEPEGRSVPPEKIQSLKKALKHDHPRVLTAVAMLRPQMVAQYQSAADVFMIDPYPVPHMPMTWLSDSLEEAARYVPRERLWAVIQAFGGDKWAKGGWPRRPTFLEMRCLSYLALVHGAHGLFYFSFPEVRPDRASWEGLTRIVQELGELRTWLVVPNEPAVPLRLEMTSPFKTDAAGRPAIHFSQKRRGSEHLLILVNVIDRPVSFHLHGFSQKTSWLTEFFRHEKTVVRDGNIREKLGPYEVRVYHYRPRD